MFDRSVAESLITDFFGGVAHVEVDDGDEGEKSPLVFPGWDLNSSFVESEDHHKRKARSELRSVLPTSKQMSVNGSWRAWTGAALIAVVLGAVKLRSRY